MPAVPTGGPSLPFGDQRSVLPFAGSPPPRRAKPTEDEPHVLPFRSTAPAPKKAPDAPSPLPFRGDAEPKPPPPAQLGAEPRNLGATMAMSSEDFAAARAALLPFLERKEQAAEVPPAQEPDLGSTSYVSPEDMAKARAALPFGAPPASADATGDDTAEIPPDGADTLSGETAEVPPDRARSALPFQPNAGPSPQPPPSPDVDQPGHPQPTLSLEQYAWLCATLERSSARREETLAWLRMSAEQKAQLDAAWRAAMARDAALAARFESLRRSYLSQG